MKYLHKYILFLNIGVTTLFGAIPEIQIKKITEEIDREVEQVLDQVLHQINSNRDEFNSILHDAVEIDSIVQEIKKACGFRYVSQPNFSNETTKEYYNFIQQRVAFWANHLNITVPILCGLCPLELVSSDYLSPLSALGDFESSQPYALIAISLRNRVEKNVVDHVVLHELQHILNRDILHTRLIFHIAKKHDINIETVQRSAKFSKLMRLHEKRADIKAGLISLDVCNQGLLVFRPLQTMTLLTSLDRMIATLLNAPYEHPTYLERFLYMRKIRNLHTDSNHDSRSLSQTRLNQYKYPLLITIGGLTLGYIALHSRIFQ